MNKNDQRFAAQKIRAQYMEKQSSELDELRALDQKVKRPAIVFSYVFGILGAIVLGIGMSLAMTDLAQTIGVTGNPMLLGSIIGDVGLVMALINYPIYAAIVKSRKKKYAPEILALSDKIVSE